MVPFMVQAGSKNLRHATWRVRGSLVATLPGRLRSARKQIDHLLLD